MVSTERKIASFKHTLTLCRLTNKTRSLHPFLIGIKNNPIRYIAGENNLKWYVSIEFFFSFMNQVEKTCTAIYQYNFQIIKGSVGSIIDKKEQRKS
jgi:hypothetical protein